MDRQSMCGLIDKMIDAKYSVEAINHITVTLMDGFKSQGNETGEKLLYCYHALLVLTEKSMQDCVNCIDELLMEMRKEEQ